MEKGERTHLKAPTSLKDNKYSKMVYACRGILSKSNKRFLKIKRICVGTKSWTCERKFHDIVAGKRWKNCNEYKFENTCRKEWSSCNKIITTILLVYHWPGPITCQHDKSISLWPRSSRFFRRVKTEERRIHEKKENSLTIRGTLVIHRRAKQWTSPQTNGVIKSPLSVAINSNELLWHNWEKRVKPLDLTLFDRPTISYFTLRFLPRSFTPFVAWKPADRLYHAPTLSTPPPSPLDYYRKT